MEIDCGCDLKLAKFIDLDKESLKRFFENKYESIQLDFTQKIRHFISHSNGRYLKLSFQKISKIST